MGARVPGEDGGGIRSEADFRHDPLTLAGRNRCLEEPLDGGDFLLHLLEGDTGASPEVDGQFRGLAAGSPARQQREFSSSREVDSRARDYFLKFAGRGRTIREERHADALLAVDAYHCGVNDVILHLGDVPQVDCGAGADPDRQLSQSARRKVASAVEDDGSAAQHGAGRRQGCVGEGAIEIDRGEPPGLHLDRIEEDGKLAIRATQHDGNRQSRLASQCPGNSFPGQLPELRLIERRMPHHHNPDRPRRKIEVRTSGGS